MFCFSWHPGGGLRRHPATSRATRSSHRLRRSRAALEAPLAPHGSEGGEASQHGCCPISLMSDRALDGQRATPSQKVTHPQERRNIGAGLVTPSRKPTHLSFFSHRTRNHTAARNPDRRVGAARSSASANLAACDMSSTVALVSLNYLWTVLSPLAVGALLGRRCPSTCSRRSPLALVSWIAWWPTGQSIAPALRTRRSREAWMLCGCASTSS